MNPIPYFLCFAAGMAVNAIYNQRQKVAEHKAYNKGYKQAQKEENIRIENRTYRSNRVYELPTAVETDTEPEQKKVIRTVDESFMESLRTNGYAVTNFK